jgi:hypothetical protein
MRVSAKFRSVLWTYNAFGQREAPERRKLLSFAKLLSPNYAVALLDYE